jgi:hypothetical protein
MGEAWQTYRAHAAHLIVIAAGILLVYAVIEGLLELAGGWIAVIAELLAGLVATYLVQAAMVLAAQDVRDGRADLSIGRTVSAASRLFLPVVGVSLLAGVVVVAGLALLIVPGLYLLTIWAVAVPVIVIERASVLPSFGRSRRLVRGNGWQVFWLLLVTSLIQLGSQQLMELALTALPAFLTTAISSVVTGALTTPFEALVVAVVYFRLAAVPSNAPAQPA